MPTLYTLGNLGVRILNGRGTEMARIWMIGMVCVLTAGPALAVAPLFTDDLENVNAWTASGTLLVPDTEHFRSGSKSAKQPSGTIIYNMKNASSFTSSTIPAGQVEVASVWFYDENLASSAGSLFLTNMTALTDYFAIGVNTGQFADKYFLRSIHNGYQTSTISRSVGWHELRIVVSPYSVP
jgi:hypothetical protein